MFDDWLAAFLDWPFWERIAVVAGAIAAVLGVIKVASELLPKVRPKNETQARETIRQMLNGRHAKRRFAVIKKRLGGVIPDDRIRDMLPELRAVRYQHPALGEMWGLREKNSV